MCFLQKLLLNEEPEDPHERTLRDIFEPEAFDEIMFGVPYLNKSPLSECLMLLSENGRTNNLKRDRPNAEELLKSLRIKLSEQRPLRPFGQSLLLLGCCNGSSPTNELTYIQGIAKLYAQNNGVPGISFAALIQEYLFFRLIASNSIKRPGFIGGESPKQKVSKVPTRVVTVCRGGEEREGSINFSLLAGSELFLKGVRSDTVPFIRDRVKETISTELGFVAEEDDIWLFHGTTIEHATAIVQNGQLDHKKFSKSTDFGEALYFANNFSYALECAYIKSGGKSLSERCHDPTVLAFLFPKSAFAANCLELDNLDEWCQVVTWCRRGPVAEDGLVDRYEAATCVVGGISANATLIDSDRQKPLSIDPTLVKQYAIKTSAVNREPLKSMYGTLREGKAHLIRVLQQSGDEWHPQQEQPTKGNGKKGKTRKGRKRR